MDTPHSSRLCTDGQLTDAVKTSTSWRGVMRALGLKTTSAGEIRLVRHHAARLELDASHFRGKRRWSDDQLRQAVAECTSWEEVVKRLGLAVSSSNAQAHIRSHTVRLGLGTDHLYAVSHVRRQPPEALPATAALPMDRKHIRVAGPVTAAAWFMLRGCAVSFPAEPAAYDLLVDTSDGISRVQVKTTTRATKYGWEAGVGHHPDTHSKKGRLLAYDPNEIDLFFIVDGDMTLYLIPSRAIAGRVVIVLRTYAKYIVGNARGLAGMPGRGGASTAGTAAALTAATA